MRLLKKENVIVSVCIILITVSCIIGYNMNSYKKDLGFVLRYGHEEEIDIGVFKLTIKGKNIIDTRYDTFTKDLVRKGSIRTNLRFTEDEMKLISDFIKSHDIMNYPENLKDYVRSYPKSIYSLRIYYEGKIKTIEWRHMRFPQPLLDNYFKENIDVKNKYIVLNELTDLILNILYEKEEYKGLPKPVGGYVSTNIIDRG